MSRILLAPYAAKLPTGKRNPKDYPWFAEVVATLNTQGHEVIQIGVKGEQRVEGVGQFVQGWPLDKLEELIRTCDCFLSVDSFLPHLCWAKRLLTGVVIWGKSSPSIWGHAENVNLIKDRSLLRRWQYAPWFDEEFDESVFVSPETVVEAVNGQLCAAAA